jgi:hypothetical protein
MSDIMVIDVDSDWRFVLTTRKILRTAQWLLKSSQRRVILRLCFPARVY